MGEDYPKNIKNGKNLEAIREQIFENDEDVRKARDYIKAYSGFLGEAMLNESIEDFMDYLKEFKETASA